MNNCKKCGDIFTPKKGLINFCSMSCRNSRIWTEDDKIKKSISAKSSEKLKKANKEKWINVDWDKIKKERLEEYNNKLLNEEFEALSYEKLRKRVILEQYNKCAKCKLDKWLDEDLILELDHIDGNNSNNSRNNLEALCPNCHSLTSTWRGRNKTNMKNTISDELLYNTLIENNWNMRQSLLKLNLAAKGGNYKRCHRLKKEYERYVCSK